VGQLSAKWPKEGEEAKTTYWSALHQSIDDLRGLMFTLDDRFETIDNDPLLSPVGRAQARAKLAGSALDELKEYAPAKKAANAVTRRIEILREKINVPPTTPQNQAEVAIAGEIRAMCRAAENPEAFAFAHRSNAQTVAAILSAPDFLSGLSAEAAERIRVVALEALHPNEVRQLADL